MINMNHKTIHSNLILRKGHQQISHLIQDCRTKIPVQMIQVMKAMDLTKFHLSKGISVQANQKS